MRRLVPLLVALVVALAGCVSAPGVSTTATTSTDATAEAPTTVETATPAPVGVEYVVQAGSVPDDIGSVTATLQVVFVERSADAGPCWRETFAGPFKPTVTPIAPPDGECHRSATVTLDLTDLDGDRSLARLTAPGRFDAGHALVVTNVTVTYRNGTAVDDVRVDERAAVVDGEPAGPYRVTLSLESYRGEDRPYDFWFVAERDG
ncbi:hypothetical protein ACOZ4L_08745 [Haloplanus ruber]|uniref:Lipoprotein n=1 Tax=Haloplanus ruber TaxID=869892 RepID=A0ABD6CVJ5_9EURY|nr:hypothetical protein [Haloplanus ruber]